MDRWRGACGSSRDSPRNTPNPARYLGAVTTEYRDRISGYFLPRIAGPKRAHSGDHMDGKWFRNSFIWLIVMVFVLAIAFQVFKGSGSSTKSVPFSGASNSLVTRLLHNMDVGTQVTLTQDGNNAILQERKTGQKYEASIGDQLDIVQALNYYGVPTKTKTFRTYVSVQHTSPSQIGNW